MANGKMITRLTAVVIVLVGVLGFHMDVMGMLGSEATADGRPDLIRIDAIAELEQLEQPAVVFYHDKHTKALKEQGLSCDSCHKTDDKGKMSLKFMRHEGKDGSKQNASELKEIYHDGCLSCHNDTGAKNLKTGPKAGECRSCHMENPVKPAARAKAGMDNALHYMHWDSKEIAADKGEQTNCGACHHSYDEQKKALVYTKGQEDSCRACHTETPQEPVKLDTAEAFHNQCVTCHQSLVVKKAEKAGPVDCAGCHGIEQVAKLKAKKAEMLERIGGTLPRLPRKQPDAVLMMPKVADAAAKADKPSGMAPVAFDHKLHENKVDTCRACHTKGVNAPMDTSFEAMHDAQSATSCIGCHAKEQKRPECAGCHEFRSNVAQPSEASCKTCHTAPKTEAGAALMLSAPKEAKEAEAKAIIDGRSDEHQLVNVDQIPEFVNIGVIADEYEASKMPHRQIVLKMVDNMKNDGLAATFHATPEAMCQGCHHNSPASVKPPKCSSCHAKTADALSAKPALKAAYHGQCMGCHTEMKLAKPAATNCVACHAKKK